MSANATVPALEKSGLLIVDDEQPLLTYLAKLFSPEFRVHTAASAKAAESVIEENEDVKVILCDHEMPGEKGLDFLARVRQRSPKLQRILMTAHARPEVFLKAINEGDVLKFLVKPSTPEAMREAIDLALAEHAKATSVEVMEHKLRSLPWLAHRFKLVAENAGGFLRAAIKVMTVSAVVALGLGIFVIGVLYVLKSVLGIDILGDLHVEEFLMKLVS